MLVPLVLHLLRLLRECHLRLLGINRLGHLRWLLLRRDGLLHAHATHRGEARLVHRDALLLSAALSRVRLVSLVLVLLLIRPSVVVVLSLRDRKSTMRCQL